MVLAKKSARGRILLWSGTGRNATAAAPLVFAGYGIRAPEFGWNDYRVEAHYAEPNEVTEIFSATRLFVLNVERNPVSRWSWTTR